VKRVPKNVLWLGVVSGLTDVSSEMLYPVVPLFLTQVLGAPMAAVGAIEGAAEAAVSLVKAAAGRWSDRSGRRKPPILVGYALSAASKPMLALATGWTCVLASRLTDRVGKGLRNPPRDALLADSTEAEDLGFAFGVHRAMDTAGAAVGPLLALLLLDGLGLGYRAVFLWAFLPAAVGVFVLAVAVREVPTPAAASAPAGPMEPLPPAFWRFTAAYGLFALGNSSDVFLLLRAADAGLSRAEVICAYVLYNVVYAAVAAPAGRLADVWGRTRTLAAGLFIFAGVYAGFARGPGPWIWALFAAYGIYAALTEGVAKAVVIERAGAGQRGTALGVFQGASGLLALAASLGAGWLWDAVSPAAPFWLGAACAVAGACALCLLRPASPKL